MSADAASLLLRAARRRRAAIVFAMALPWCAAATAIAWRASSASTAAVIVTVTASILALALLAWHRAHRLDRRWLQRHLDANHPRLEDSSALLAADASRLPPLARLQRERVLERLPAAEAAGVRAPWPRGRILASALAAAVVVGGVLAWPVPSPRTTPAGSPSVAPAFDESAALQLVQRRLEITPPAYTGLPTTAGEHLDAKAPEGARLAWTLRFTPSPDAVALEFLDGRRVDLRRDGDAWRADIVATRSGLYRIVATSALPWQDEALHRIDVVPDRPPSIRVTAPAQTLSLRTPGQRHWALAFEAEDDHGIAAAAEMHLTMTEGSGENIDFREEVRHLTGQGNRRAKRYTHRLDLDALGLSEGDDLIVRFVVRDNRAGGTQSTRSASHILRWPPPQARTDSGIDGVLQRVLPAYFSSQRQIIIDAEALIAERPRLRDAEFAARSDAIAVDQRLLRLRYGQFLGEESEGAPTLPVSGVAKEDLPPPPILLPTNDAEDEADAWRDMVAGQQHDHDHDDQPARDAGDSNGRAGAAAEAGHGHDHGAGDGAAADEPGRSGFGVASDVLEEFGHTHDIPEAATLLDPKTRALLRRALGEMWQSELALRQARPGDALPPANRALALVKEIQQTDRIHLARTGTMLPPVDFGRRLSGKHEGIASRRDGLVAADAGEDLPAMLWRALAPSVGGDAGNGNRGGGGGGGGDGNTGSGRDAMLRPAALQAWIEANAARIGDPLALLAALDAVQRDPACDDCRGRLRALLWPLATPPPAAPRARAAADGTGQAYLDALRAGEAE